MRTIILALLVCGAAFGQCGPLALNPVTGYLDCTGTAGGSGTVTSVGLAGTANQITVTGATPITTSGSWTLSIPTNPTLPGNVTVTGTVTTGDGTVAGQLNMVELTANGTNFRSWLVPDLLTADLTMKFPDAVPSSGDVLTFGAPSSNISVMAFKGVASANTASAIVARDGSGNFTAGTITAALTGNASTATALTATGANPLMVFSENMNGATVALSTLSYSGYGSVSYNTFVSRYMVVPFAGTIKNLRAQFGGAQNAGGSLDCAVYTGTPVSGASLTSGSASAVAFSLVNADGANAIKTDLTHSVAVAAGDAVVFGCNNTYSGGVSSGTVWWSFGLFL